MNLFTLLAQSAARNPSHGAVYEGEALFATYGELHRRALALGGAMARLVEPGGRIAIATKNCPSYIEILFGAWAAGLVVTPINAKLHPREMGDVLVDSGAGLLFTSWDLAAELAGRAPSAACHVVTIGSDPYAAMLAAARIARSSKRRRTPPPSSVPATAAPA